MESLQKYHKAVAFVLVSFVLVELKDEEKRGVCVCVCMQVKLWERIRVCTQIYTLHIHMWIHACMYMFLCACIYIHTYIHAHTHYLVSRNEPELALDA